MNSRLSFYDNTVKINRIHVNSSYTDSLPVILLYILVEVLKQSQSIYDGYNGCVVCPVQDSVSGDHFVLEQLLSPREVEPVAVDLGTQRDAFDLLASGLRGAACESVRHSARDRVVCDTLTLEDKTREHHLVVNFIVPAVEDVMLYLDGHVLEDPTHRTRRMSRCRTSQGRGSVREYAIQALRVERACDRQTQTVRGVMCVYDVPHRPRPGRPFPV